MALAGLLDLEGFRVAEGSIDARGWPLYDARGDLVGQVEDLIVDTEVMEARYMQVALHDLARSVVLSVPELQIDARHRRVICPRASKDQIELLPYIGGSDLDEPQERRLIAAFAPSIEEAERLQAPYMVLRVQRLLEE
ncbi:MAG TPA: PRC-barrel domain-containing protein [Stenomitos sp.]